MGRNSRAGWRRPASTLALTLAALSGCATRSNTVRPVAPDLLNVSAVAPAIDAELARSPGPDLFLPLPLGEDGGEGRGTTSDRQASPPPDRVAMRRPSPPAPLPRGEGRQTGPARPRGDAAVASASSAPEPPQLPRPEVNPDAGLMGPTPPLPTPAATTPPSIPQSAAPYPIDLSAALRLADNQNPVIGEARTLILGALAERQAARALLLPYLNAGTNYHDHTGPLQRSNGSILQLTEQSLYFGGGARSVAAESIAIPAVNIFSPLTDAIFSPWRPSSRSPAPGSTPRTPRTRCCSRSPRSTST